MEPCDLTIKQANTMIHNGLLSPVELVESTINRIEKIEDKIQAWVSIDKENAIQSAIKQEEEIKEGKYLGPLHGVPIGVKDIFYTKKMRTTACSQLLSDFIPKYDATSIKLLKEKDRSLRELDIKVNCGYRTVVNQCKELEYLGIVELVKHERNTKTGRPYTSVKLTQAGRKLKT